LFSSLGRGSTDCASKLSLRPSSFRCVRVFWLPVARNGTRQPATRDKYMTSHVSLSDDPEPAHSRVVLPSSCLSGSGRKANEGREPFLRALVFFLCSLPPFFFSHSLHKQSQILHKLCTNKAWIDLGLVYSCAPFIRAATQS
jgi:hypothetical protein